MEEQKIIVRMADTRDAQEMLDIYEPYVKETAITFEYEPPALEEFSGRIKRTLERYPWLAAVDGERIAGYSYVSPFKDRAAYDWAVETTIYIRPEYKGQGIGKLLYGKLEAILKEQHILNLNACIACPKIDDEYLTRNSINFHEHLGYRFVGEFEKCGYKFGRWYNMVWMEKHIGEHHTEQPPVIPFPELKDLPVLKELS